MGEVKTYTSQQFYGDLVAIARRQEIVYQILGKDPTYFRESGWKGVVAVKPVLEGLVVTKAEVSKTSKFSSANQPLLDDIVETLKKKVEVVRPDQPQAQ